MDAMKQTTGKVWTAEELTEGFDWQPLGSYGKADDALRQAGEMSIATSHACRVKRHDYDTDQTDEIGLFVEGVFYVRGLRVPLVK